MIYQQLESQIKNKEVKYIVVTKNNEFLVYSYFKNKKLYIEYNDTFFTKKLSCKILKKLLNYFYKNNKIYQIRVSK